MTVRRVKRRNPKSGRMREFWLVDVDFLHPDGRRERVRKVSPVQTRRGAEQYERELRLNLMNGTFRKEEEVVEEEVVPTLQEFRDQFMSMYASTNNKASTIATKEWSLDYHWVPLFGDRRLDHFDDWTIDQFKATKIGEGLSPKTVNNLVSVLVTLLRFAKKAYPNVGVPSGHWLKSPEPDFDFLSFEEADLLITASKDDPLWGPMMVVGLRTGLRLGELRALTWDAVQLEAGRLLVWRSAWKGTVGTPKNGKKQEVPLSAEAVAALRARRHRLGAYVFCGEDGAMLTKEQCKWPLWRMCGKAGIRRIGWHVLRHTFASHLVMRGVAIRVVQELMRHSDIHTTMRYAHLSPNVPREAVMLLDSQRQHDGHTAESEE